MFRDAVNRPASALALSTWIFCLLPLATASAGLPPDPPFKVGGQFPVNLQTNNNQFLPHVDYNENGEFACTWTDDTNVKVRVFNADGSAKTSDLLANTTTLGTQNESQVAIGADGRFVVLWTDYNGADGELLGVFAQRYDGAGNRVGGEFIVNQTTMGSQWECMVDFDASYNMVFAWVDSIPGDGSNAGIFARVFRWDTTPLTNEFLVNDDDIQKAQVNPSLWVDSDGSFVVAWQSRNGNDGSFDRVLVRRFTAAGTPLWPSQQVNQTTIGPQNHPSVVSRDDGTFVVVFTDSGGTGDGDSGAVFFRIYDVDGNALTNEIRANMTTAGSQAIGEAAWDGANVIVIAWTDYSGIDGSASGIYWRAFTLEGAALGAEARANTSTENNQIDADIAMNTDGAITIIWEDQSGLDGDGSGIFGQRYFFSATVVPGTSFWSQALLVLALLAAGTWIARRLRP